MILFCLIFVLEIFIIKVKQGKKVPKIEVNFN